MRFISEILLICIQMLWIIPSWFIGNTAYVFGLDLYRSILLMLFSAIFITFMMYTKTTYFVIWLDKKLKK